MSEAITRIPEVSLASFSSIGIDEAEKVMLTCKQEDAGVVHKFSPGLYIREVTLPAGTIAIGHHQNFEHLNVFLKGRVSVLNSDGSLTELRAPMVFVGKPGRKVGYIHEEVVWQNIYPTDVRDVEKLEQHLITKSEAFQSRPLLESESYDADRIDYALLLSEYGYTHEQARAQSENIEDQIDFPVGGYKIMVSNSALEGKGIFATARIDAGEIIAPSLIGGKRTPAGRYTNHSVAPNAEMRIIDGIVYLVATKDIAGCRGGFLGGEVTVNYRQVLNLSQTLKE